MRRTHLIPLVLSLCLAMSARAQSKPAEPGDLLAAEIEAAEEQLDDGLKRFGYLTGLALGCVETGQRVQLEREAMDLNAGISRTLGADRAFLFSAAFGYGTNIELKVDECKTVLERYTARVEKFRQGQQGGKK